MGTDREIIYFGRDNSIDLRLKASGVSQNLTNTTKIQVIFGSGVTIDSSVSPTLFSGTTSTVGALSLKFGSLSDRLTSGTVYNAEILVYDDSNTNGINWGTIPIKVVG